MQRIVFITIIGVVALLVGGCGGAMAGGSMAGMDHGNMDQSGMMTDTQTMTDTTMMSGTRMMSDTQMSGMDHSRMSVNPDQPFDAQFMDAMLEHHWGAVAMAEQALEQTEHPELRTLAEAIIAAQTQEIEEMTAWRASWYPGLAPTGGLAMNMGEMTISNDESKPFDQRFMEAMLSHHQGAIEMAQLAQQMGEHAEIKTLADAIITAQQADIEQMTDWLQAWFGIGAAASPYIAQVASPVRGLSAQEVDDLRAGRGMGYARMAGLNSYPGPRHLLDLQKKLQLSAAQVAAINTIFIDMQSEAQQLGAQILTHEQELSTAFADHALDETALNAQITTLADFYGQLRMTHLRAHLQVTPLLTAEQITAYDQLRGYTGGEQSTTHEMHH